MKFKCGMGLLGACVILLLVSPRGAEAQTAVASPVTRSSTSRPSSFQIQQNFYAIEIASIKRQLQQVQRCIANAANPQILRDFEGNVNRVPKIDAITCAYQLKQLQRQLANIARQQAKLAQDASAQAGFLEVAQRQAELQQLLRALAGQRGAATSATR